MAAKKGSPIPIFFTADYADKYGYRTHYISADKCGLGVKQTSIFFTAEIAKGEEAGKEKFFLRVLNELCGETVKFLFCRGSHGSARMDFNQKLGVGSQCSTLSDDRSSIRVR